MIERLSPVVWSRLTTTSAGPANKLAKAGNVRLYVMVAPDGSVIGFHAINAHSVRYDELPRKYARTRPGHDNIPAAYISMIGRDNAL